MSKIRALDEEDQTTVEWIVSHLRRATDEDLERFYVSQHRAALDLIDDHVWRVAKQLGDLPPLFVAAMGMRDLIVHEKHRRHDVIRRAEAELNGGHLVGVSSGKTPGTYGAYCLPGDDYCWEGSDRETVEQALADGRRHYPGSEPQVDPGCLT